MIEYYSFGSMTISGKRYTSDLKIINGQVHPEWRRKKGHSVAVDEVTDILNAKPDYLIIGSGKFGLMKISAQLRRHLSDCGIEVIVERSKTAMKTYNQMYADGKNIAGGFHLSCWLEIFLEPAMECVQIVNIDITSPSGYTQHVSMGGVHEQRAVERAREMIDMEIAMAYED